MSRGWRQITCLSATNSILQLDVEIVVHGAQCHMGNRIRLPTWKIQLISRKSLHFQNACGTKIGLSRSKMKPSATAMVMATAQ